MTFDEPYILTNNGLQPNVEIMAEATGDDMTRTWGEVRGLHEKGWDCAERLAEHMGAECDPTPEEYETEFGGGDVEKAGVEASGGGSWRPDPTNRNQYRWWDGNRWTLYVANDGAMTTDPMSERHSGSHKSTTAGHVSTTRVSESLVRPTSERRVAAFALECALFFVTLFIGWVIWSLVAYGQGQTPDKQMLKMRVVKISDGSTARGWRMFVREIFGKSGFWFAFLVAAPFPGIAAIFMGLTCLWMLIGWIVAARDPTGRTPWDKMLGTVVVTATAQK